MTRLGFTRHQCFIWFFFLFSIVLLLLKHCIFYRLGIVDRVLCCRLNGYILIHAKHFVTLKSCVIKVIILYHHYYYYYYIWARQVNALLNEWKNCLCRKPCLHRDHCLHADSPKGRGQWQLQRGVASGSSKGAWPVAAPKGRGQQQLSYISGQNQHFCNNAETKGYEATMGDLFGILIDVPKIYYSNIG